MAAASALLAFVSKRAVLELVVYSVLYAIVFGFHSRRSVPTYNQKFRKTTSYHLPVHIATGLFEITRYQMRVARHGEAVVPHVGDVIVCLIWAWTSLALVRSLQRGDPSTTRPAYQAGIILRPLVCLASVVLQSPPLYRVGAKAINSFIYARVGIFVLKRSGFLHRHSPSAVYSLSIPISAILSIHEGGVLGAVPVYIAVMFAVARLNRWVSAQLKGLHVSTHGITAKTSSLDWFLHAMLLLGFAELDDVKRMRRQRPSLSLEIEDEYINARRRTQSCRPARTSVKNSAYPETLHPPSWNLYTEHSERVSRGRASSIHCRPRDRVPLNHDLTAIHVQRMSTEN